MAVDSSVKICNLALQAIGNTSFITSLSEDTTEADVCNQWYDLERQKLLRNGRWHFAERRATLAALGTPPDEWGYSYAWPSDCLKPLYIDPGLQHVPEEGQNVAYKLDTTGTAKRILTDLEDAELIYTFDLTDVTLMSAEFIAALAAEIGAKVAMPLTGKRVLARDLLVFAQNEVWKAGGAEHRDEYKRGPDQQDPDWQRARW